MHAEQRPQLRSVASRVDDGDGELALRRTALTLEPDVLPLGATVEELTVTGGTITAAGAAARGGAPLDGLARPGH